MARPTAARWRARFDALLRHVTPGRDGVARVDARRIYILPTPTGLLYAAVLFVMLLGSLNYQNNPGLLLTFFMGSVGVIAMHHAWFNLRGLVIQVRGGAPVFAGEPALFTVTLGDEAHRARHDLGIRAGAASCPPARLGPDDRRPLPVALPTTRRGHLPLGALVVETRHPMRLFRAWCLVSTDAVTLVYPRPAPGAPPPVPALGHDPRYAPRNEQGGDGAEDYLGPRAYRPGDSPRHIDWKANARGRGLLVKQFGGAQGQDAWIDWSALAPADPERRIALMTRQVLDADSAGIRFGLRLPGQVTALATGPAHVQTCLTHLALFEPVFEPVFEPGFDHARV